MDQPDPIGTEIAQYPGERLQPVRREYANQLPSYAGRIGQRADEIEDCPCPQFDAHRRDMAHSGVMGLGHHEAYSSLRHTARDVFRREADSDFEGGENVGGTGFRGGGAIAVLSNFDSACGDDQRGKRRNIVRARTVTAGSDDVDRRAQQIDPQHLGPQRGNRTGDFLDGFPPHPERRKEGAELCWRHLARQNPVEGRLRFTLAEACAGENLGDERLEILHQVTMPRALASRRSLRFQASASLRKLPTSIAPFSEAMLSGWNWTPCTGRARCDRAMIMPSSLTAVI